VSQRRTVARLLAKFRPQSPTIGADHITARMRQVKDAIDRRFGPFAAIGCYRPGTDGEHPLGRACDFMLDSGAVMPSASNVQLGYEITAWAQANASRLGIMYIIYRQRIWHIRMASSGRCSRTEQRRKGPSARRLRPRARRLPVTATAGRPSC
jgi:hypothetical protein